MPKLAREISGVELRRITKPGTHAVGGVAGLLLNVTPNGGRSWLLRTKVGEKRREIGLGAFPEVSLADARAKAAEAKEQIRQGHDPVEHRKARQRALRLSQATQQTFRECASDYHESRAKGFKSKKHKADWINSLIIHAYPTIGDVPVHEIDMAAVLRVLSPIWSSRTETASRVRQRIERVLDYAKAKGYREGDNPAAWRGNLETQLAAPGDVADKQNQPALEWQRMGEFMAALRTREGMGARALEFAILTATRSGEVRKAEWSEIDMKAGMWVIPASRMKGKNRREHKVPLSEPALALLRSLPRFQDCRYIFPSAKNTPISDMTMSAVTKRMHEASIKAGGEGYLDPNQGNVIVPHGFRSSFRDWAAESTAYPNHVVEMALAHAIGSKVEAAYRRGDLFNKRKELMREWAKFMDTLKPSGEVLPIRGAK